MLKQILAIAVLLATASSFAQTGGPIPYSDDARARASDEEVRIARRAYRAACQKHRNVEYCECMTGGMAQALAPADLRAAASFFSVDPARPATSGAPTAAGPALSAHTQFDPACRAQGL